MEQSAASEDSQTDEDPQSRAGTAIVSNLQVVLGPLLASKVGSFLVSAEAQMMGFV